MALNELATCPNSDFETGYDIDTVSIIFHIGKNCAVEDRGYQPKMVRMGNRRTWSKKSKNYIIGIGCGLESAEKKEFDDFIRRGFIMILINRECNKVFKQPTQLPMRRLCEVSMKPH